MESTRWAVRGLALGAGTALLLLGGGNVAFADHVPPGDTFQPVTYCHAAPPDDPKRYIEITTDNAAVIVGHGEEHDGDIIPSFEYVDANGDHQTYPGKNLDDSEILENGCVIPTTTTSPTTTSPTTTTSTSSTSTSTTSSSPGRPIPSGGVDTGGVGVASDDNFNAPVSFSVLGALLLALGTPALLRRRKQNG